METITKTKWVIDKAHSEIGFKIKHLMISNVKGVFNDFDAEIFSSGDDFLSTDIDLWLDPKSIDTGNTDRDNHLKGADFFDSEQYKEINFTSNTIEKKGDNFSLYGDLTIKGITKQVKLDVEFGGIMKDPWGNTKAGFTVTGKINRKDWGLNWNAALETGGFLVSDDVTINCEIQLLKSQQA